ncbi:hypothetical protein EMCRGX_G022857 [Ephydatia muelleri]
MDISIALMVALVSWRVDGLCVDGGIRLMGGRAQTADGRVEVCYNNVWGRVCDSSWSSLEAGVVCKQLGYQGGVPYNDGYFGRSSGPVYLSNVRCLGSETNLIGCSHDHISSSSADCHYTTDVGVSCYNQTKVECTDWSLRLVGGKESGVDGRLEVCLSNQWGTVSGTNWNDKNTGVVCRQLNATFSGGMTSSTFSPATGPIQLSSVSCLGNEPTILECDHTSVAGPFPDFSNHESDIGIRCWKNATLDQLPSPYLLITTNAGVLQMGMDGTHLALVVDQPTLYPMYGLDYDIREGTLYWSSYTYQQRLPIQQSHLDGSGISPMLDAACIAGISLDWVHHRLFWTNYCDGSIHMYDLTNGTDTLLFNSTLSDDVAVDPINGFIYWSSQTPGRIERGSLIGGSREVLHSTDLACVLSLSLDLASDRLVWNDFCLLKIEMSFTNGSHRTTLLSPINAYGMALFRGVLYWTERSDQNLIHAVKSLRIGSRGNITTVANFSIEPVKIRVVDMSTQPLANPLKLNCSSTALGARLVVNCSANHTSKSLSCSVQNRTIDQCKLPLTIDLPSVDSTTITIVITATDVYGLTSASSVLYTKPTPYIHLVNNSPKIKGNSVSFDVTVSQPILSMFCQVTNQIKNNCTLGHYTVQGLQAGTYTFTAQATTADGQTAVISRHFNIASGSSDCVLVLTNDGIMVTKDVAIVEFASTGSPKAFICIIDNKRSIYPCTSPLKLSGLGTGSHTLMMGTTGCAGNSPVMVETFQVM